MSFSTVSRGLRRLRDEAQKANLFREKWVKGARGRNSLKIALVTHTGAPRSGRRWPTREGGGTRAGPRELALRP